MFAPAMGASLQQVTSVATIARGVQQGWMQMVGTYVGRSWTPGDSMRESLSQPLPGLPGAMMVTAQVTRYEGVVPCPTTSKAATCWRFTRNSEVDMSAMRAALAGAMESMGLSDPGTVQDLPIPRTASTSYLVMDASTTQPLEIGMSVVSTMTISGADMTSRTTTVLRYVWSGM